MPCQIGIDAYRIFIRVHIQVIGDLLVHSPGNYKNNGDFGECLYHFSQSRQFSWIFLHRKTKTNKKCQFIIIVFSIWSCIFITFVGVMRNEFWAINTAQHQVKQYSFNCLLPFFSISQQKPNKNKEFIFLQEWRIKKKLPNNLNSNWAKK